MEKSSSSCRLVSLVIPFLAAALALPACSSGEMPSTSNGSGGSTSGSGGRSTSGSGGSTSSGSGGSTTSGSGGSSTSGSGGSTGFGSGGATGFGTGGSSTTGSGGSIITGASGGSTGTPGSLTTTAGFASNGTWMGYAYTATFPATGSTATVSPVCPTPCFTAATSLCAMGTVGADATFGSGAVLGWNVKQAMATTAVSPPIETYTTAGTGLSINVSGMVTGLRVQIQNTTGSWCANLTSTGANMIPWAMFNTKCWDPAMGMAFTAGTAITAVQIVVPSGAAAVPFNFCLVDAKPY